MLDLTKPVQTRDGRKVRILCTDMKSGCNSAPIVGLIMEKQGFETMYNWFEGGSMYPSSGDCNTDLVQVPTEEIEVS